MTECLSESFKLIKAFSHWKWPDFKWLNNREVLKMILYRWKHRGGSSLNKFPALNTVHFAIFDDIKSPYHALETIFTVDLTGNRNGPIFGKFWVKIGLFPPKNWDIIGHFVALSVWSVRMCGPSFTVRPVNGPHGTVRDFNKFFMDLFLCGLIQVLM